MVDDVLRGYILMVVPHVSQKTRDMGHPAEWTISGLNVVLGEVRSLQQGYLGTSVTVADSAFVTQRVTEREAERSNTLD